MLNFIRKFQDRRYSRWQREYLLSPEHLALVIELAADQSRSEQRRWDWEHRYDQWDNMSDAEFDALYSPYPPGWDNSRTVD